MRGAAVTTDVAAPAGNVPGKGMEHVHGSVERAPV